MTVEIADGATAIAEVVPPKKPIAVKDLPALMASLPSLGNDAISFANDIELGRKVLQPDEIRGNRSEYWCLRELGAKRL